MKSSVLSTARRKTSEPAEKFAFFYYSRNTHDAFWAIIRSCFCWPAVRTMQVLFVVDYVFVVPVACCRGTWRKLVLLSVRLFHASVSPNRARRLAICPPSTVTAKLFPTSVTLSVLCLTIVSSHAHGSSLQQAISFPPAVVANTPPCFFFSSYMYPHHRPSLSCWETYLACRVYAWCSTWRPATW